MIRRPNNDADSQDERKLIRLEHKNARTETSITDSTDIKNVKITT